MKQKRCWNCRNKRVSVTTSRWVVFCILHDTIIDREGTCVNHLVLVDYGNSEDK